MWKLRGKQIFSPNTQKYAHESHLIADYRNQKPNEVPALCVKIYLEEFSHSLDRKPTVDSHYNLAPILSYWDSRLREKEEDNLTSNPIKSSDAVIFI